ncbi:ATP synthase subunit I [Caldalkalibacillus mannanilyticus]|uniref:ATP synthase subunit I n=1 Tax=Caldalkalibacillus mannanilyticus TaxID=1418 RepID=UPI00046A1AFA|nr:ATP synthase subunit I [Caldalkalibacillus mannanilyticus]
MEEYIRQVKRLSITLCSVLIASVILWLLTSYSTWVAGFALGLFIGLFNTLLTGIKVHRFSEAIAQGGRRAGLGMATRFSMAILGASLPRAFRSM